ncbi:MAG: hypothetical protein H6557_13150 [Lewinellaceae bacterium]|nr:hypothetical protein [Phaeodactylibacter sp.]MCB9037554.1 hypothetical protein [Lewinellaceae bacterium]
MKTQLFAFFALLGSLAFFSCNSESSDSVNQDRIFTVYELFYNANEDKTYARATFYFSNELGTRLELAGDSKVSFDGDPLTFNPVLAYYEREYAGFRPQGAFEWTDTEGNAFRNTVEIRPIRFASGIDTIDRSQSYELFWEEGELKANELVVLTINGENEGDARIFSTNDVGATSIILAKNKLSEVGQGPGTVFLERSFIPAIQEAPSAGGRVTGRQRAENLEVYLK